MTPELQAALAYAHDNETQAEFDLLTANAKPLKLTTQDHAFRILAAEVRRLQEDAKRLDWLADRNNGVGQVLLPTACVQAHPADMRAAIDAAMMEGGK